VPTGSMFHIYIIYTAMNIIPNTNPTAYKAVEGIAQVYMYIIYIIYIYKCAECRVTETHSHVCQ